jgi:putative acetyltransferase
MLAPELPGFRIEPADPIGPVARALIERLCAEMSARYGTAPSPFSLSEAAEPRSTFLVAYLDGAPVGCGALRRIDGETAEIKRMYIAPEARRKGIARRIIRGLEEQAQAFGYRAIRLETGVRQPEAQSLYEAAGFHRIASFGPYMGNPTSVCFEKTVRAASC